MSRTWSAPARRAGASGKAAAAQPASEQRVEGAARQAGSVRGAVARRCNGPATQSRGAPQMRRVSSSLRGRLSQTKDWPQRRPEDTMGGSSRSARLGGQAGTEWTSQPMRSRLQASTPLQCPNLAPDRPKPSGGSSL